MEIYITILDEDEDVKVSIRKKISKVQLDNLPLSKNDLLAIELDDLGKKVISSYLQEIEKNKESKLNPKEK